MTQWFFGFSGNAAGWFREMVQVAVLSAKANTSLEAHCIYDGPDNDLIDWLDAAGVTVHRDQVPFRDELFSEVVKARNAGSHYSPEHATGHFLRLLVARHASGDAALYTDCDVMFRRDPTVTTPVRVAAAAELKDGQPSSTSFNSGVMLFNLANYRAISDDLIAFCRENGFYRPKQSSYDQVLLNLYYANKWETLPPTMNWRPSQGVNVDAEIVHFHGPKPHRVQAILDGRGIRGEEQLLPIIERDREAYDSYIAEFRSYLLMA